MSSFRLLSLQVNKLFFFLVAVAKLVTGQLGFGVGGGGGGCANKIPSLGKAWIFSEAIHCLLSSNRWLKKENNNGIMSCNRFCCVTVCGCHWLGQ